MLAQYEALRGKDEELELKIDNLEQQRLAKISHAVQKEHEACANDIHELKWHISYRKREEGKIKTKFDKTEFANRDLREEIDFIKEHSPLLKEKLDLEDNAMGKIDNAQDNTISELDFTKDRLDKVQAHSNELNRKAKAEREKIAADLKEIHKKLNSVVEKLKKAYSFQRKCEKITDESKTKIAKNEENTLVYEVKLENLKEKVKLIQEKVEKLEIRISDLSTEQNHLQLHLNESYDHYEVRKATLEERFLMNETEIARLTKDYRDICAKNKENHIRVLDMQDKLDNLKKLRVQHQCGYARMEKELISAGEQAKVVLEDFDRVKYLHAGIKTELDTQQQKAQRVEADLKSRISGLRHQYEEEKIQKNTLRGMMQKDEKDLARLIDAFRIKKAKIDQAYKEVSDAVAQLEAKVNKLESAHKQREQLIERLKHEIEKTSAEHEATEIELSDRLREMKDALEVAEKEKKKVDDQLEDMRWQTDMMKKKNIDMTESGAMMQKKIDKMVLLIEELEEQRKELQARYDDRSDVEEAHTADLQNNRQRLYRAQIGHEKLMKNRREFLETHLHELNILLAQNRNFASLYRRLQNDFAKFKTELLSKYDNRLWLETALKDQRQLYGFQMRLQVALEHYHQLRGELMDKKVIELQSNALENSARVSGVRGTISGELQNVSDMVTKEVSKAEKARQRQKPKLLPRIASTIEEGAVRSAGPKMHLELPDIGRTVVEKRAVSAV